MTLPIAGTVLPLKRAEELILSLPSVVSARIVSTDSGAVSEIHVLTTGEIPAKQMVRNIESALIAHFSMRVDHRKISVAVTETPQRPQSARATPSEWEGDDSVRDVKGSRRRLYFEDIEVQASRTKGVICRVSLMKNEVVHVGEASGFESDRTRLELAARATLIAIGEAEGKSRQVSLDGVKVLEAFDRNYVFVGVLVRFGRAAHHLTGSCEIRDSAETSSVLAVLDSMNRWLDL